jgi:hypothetical protein
MTGGTLLELVLISMAWLFFLLGALLNLDALRRARNARAGEHAPRMVPVLPGVVGSMAAFFTLPLLAGHGIKVAWPWFWILLPLFLDVGCAARVLGAWAGRKSL